MPSTHVFSDALVVFALSTYSHFVVLQSAIHDSWAWKYSSTLGDTTLRYGASDCFDTFPFPTDTNLAAISLSLSMSSSSIEKGA